MTRSKKMVFMYSSARLPANSCSEMLELLGRELRLTVQAETLQRHVGQPLKER